MKPVPLAIGSTQPVTVTSLPSFTEIFDFDVCSVVCALSPTAHKADTQAAAAMSFIVRLLLVQADATIVPTVPTDPGNSPGSSRYHDCLRSSRYLLEWRVRRCTRCDRFSCSR